MKKFLSIIMIMFIAFTAVAQESSTYDYEMKYKSDLYGGTWLAKAFQAVDSIGDGDSVWYYTVKKLTTNKVYGDFRVVLDSLGGTPSDVSIAFQYKSWLKDPWTTLATTTYYGTVDTAFNYTGTAVIADYWRIHISTATAGFQVGVDSLYFKFVY